MPSCSLHNCILDNLSIIGCKEIGMNLGKSVRDYINISLSSSFGNKINLGQYILNLPRFLKTDNIFNKYSMFLNCLIICYDIDSV